MQDNQNRTFKKRKAFDNLVFGRQPVIELLDGEKTIDKILIQKSGKGEHITEIRNKAQLKEIPVQFVPDEKLTALTGGNHQGVIAFTTEISFQKIEQLLPFIIEKGEVPLIIILDSITDVRNFGAIARTAYAAGAHCLIIGTSNAAPVNAEAIKASAGALQLIPVCREKSLSAALDFLQLNGMCILGADINATDYLFNADMKNPTAVILGSEDEGISSNLRKYLSQTIKIPMHHSFDSYNVSVAAGMFLYEAMKQRMV
jgi:23S rRNA (guanosine2251-2'-O)-methyltransferase